MFAPIKNKKVYQQVVEQIQKMVLEGNYKRGDKLPAERELAEILGISRTSVREALRALEVIGLVESKQGEGNFIKQHFENVLFEPLSVMFMLSEGKAKDILQLRKIIEVESAHIAASEITEEKQHELKVIMDRLKASKDEKESAEFDQKFHYKIAECTQNDLIIYLLNAISSLIRTFIKDARWEILQVHESRSFLVKQHEDIYNAIVKKDPKKASYYMNEHLEFIYNVVEKL